MGPLVGPSWKSDKTYNCPLFGLTKQRIFDDNIQALLLIVIKLWLLIT
jgi:hypothetical protein